MNCLNCPHLKQRDAVLPFILKILSAPRNERAGSISLQMLNGVYDWDHDDHGAYD